MLFDGDTSLFWQSAELGLTTYKQLIQGATNLEGGGGLKENGKYFGGIRLGGEKGKKFLY